MKSFLVSLPHHNRLFTLDRVCSQNLEKTGEARLHFTSDVAPAHLVYLLLKLGKIFCCLTMEIVFALKSRGILGYIGEYLNSVSSYVS